MVHCPSSNLCLASGTGAGARSCRDSSWAGSGRHSLDRRLQHHPESALGAVSAAPALRCFRHDRPGVGVGNPHLRKSLGPQGAGPTGPGLRADLARFTLDRLRFSGSHETLAALALCGADRAEQVMVGGQRRVVVGAIPRLDLAALITRHSAAARSLVAASRILASSDGSAARAYYPLAFQECMLPHNSHRLFAWKTWWGCLYPAGLNHAKRMLTGIGLTTLLDRTKEE